MTGFNMPPGVSVRDIPGYDAPEPSAESERACELLDADPVLSDESRDEVVRIVDRLADERSRFRDLLISAVQFLPPHQEPQCNCDSADAFNHCPLHDGTDPTLRQEIEAAILGCSSLQREAK